MKTAKYLRNYYPEAQIEGGIYPPPDLNTFIASIASYLFIFGMIVIFFGEAIAQRVNIPQIKDICLWISQNKMQTFIGLYVINLIGSNLLQTGAFEVWVQDELIWSKIETGRLPDMQYLLAEIAKLAPA